MGKRVVLLTGDNRRTALHCMAIAGEVLYTCIMCVCTVELAIAGGDELMCLIWTELSCHLTQQTSITQPVADTYNILCLHMCVCR